MSTLRVSQIEKPARFEIAPMRRGRGQRRPVVIGFDTESDKHRPFLLTWAVAGEAEQNVYLGGLDGTRLACLHAFMDRIATLRDRSCEYVVFAYNLRYELTRLFGDLATVSPDYAEMVREPSFEFEYHGPALRGQTAVLPGVRRFSIAVLNEPRRVGITIRDLASGRVIRVVDAAQFYKGGLDAVGNGLGLGGKAPDPWRGRFTRDLLTVPAFMEYARRDAWLTAEIGQAIVSLQREFDVPQCWSGAQLAGRIFRRGFLQTNIPLGSADVEAAGLAAMHGGKLRYHMEGPQRVEGVWHYDMTSAYAAAMMALPDPTKSQWRYATSYEPGSHALWRIDFGRLVSCRYGSIQASDGTWSGSSFLSQIWLTSYELDALLELGEVNVSHVEGYVMEGPSGGPLAEYVHDFFERKRGAVGAYREAMKLLLTALSGKFAQRNPVDGPGYVPVVGEEDGPPEGQWRAGGLYAPHLYALITGWVRARVHRFEHKYKALLTSVDGFVAMLPPDPADIGTGLGELRASHGTLTAWRSRLYLFQRDNGELSAALHGFPGTVDDLLRLPLAAGCHSLMVTRPTSLRRTPPNVAPGTFLEHEAKITLDTS